MQAYIAISFSHRPLLTEALQAITEALQHHHIQPFIFVDQYHFSQQQDKEMMQQAFADIDASDILIAETSEKAIGIGVEVGYAKARNKTIIYLRHQAAEHSTTVAGSSDFQIIYQNAADLKQQLLEILKK
jgi:2'-deoxynucleoside 5'-phosphate N-hydrolase